MLNKAVAHEAAQSRVDAGLRDHMNSVYGMMSVGTLVTFVTAWIVATNEGVLSIFFNPETLMPTLWGWIAIFAPLAMIFITAFIEDSASPAGLKLYFGIFAAVMGISLTSIFLVYELGSIANIFLLTSAAFAGLSLWGYTTKKDISAWGSFLIMGLIGLIGAMIINIFVGSTVMDFAISVIGVLIFSGLTAYDTQKIKTDYIRHTEGSSHYDREWLEKSAIMGALSLYLDFINLFIHLLSLLGNRK